MITSTTLYWGKEEDGQGRIPFILRARRADLFFSRRYAVIAFSALYRGKEEYYHGHHPLLLRSILLFFLGLGGVGLLFPRRYATITSTALY